MNISQKEVIATLKSCLPIYHQLFDRVGYQLTADDLDCLEKFYQLWKAGLLDDEEVLKEAGMSFEEHGFLVGYVDNLKQNPAKSLFETSITEPEQAK